MTAADLSYEDIKSIMFVFPLSLWVATLLIAISYRKLVAQTSKYGLSFTEFACGLYFVRALQSSQLHALPKSIPQHLLEHFKDSSPTPTPPSSQPPPISKPTLTNRRPSAVSPRPPSFVDTQISPPSKLTARSASPSPRHSQIGSSSSWHSAESDWAISPHDRSLFEQYFRSLDKSSEGYLEKEVFEVFASMYRLPASDLSRIWYVP